VHVNESGPTGCVRKRHSLVPMGARHFRYIRRYVELGSMAQPRPDDATEWGPMANGRLSGKMAGGFRAYCPILAPKLNLAEAFPKLSREYKSKHEAAGGQYVESASEHY